MSGERWIIVDTTASNKPGDARYLGPVGWEQTIRVADTFASREEAEDEARREHILGAPFIRIRRVVTSGTKRDATDEACAMATAAALARAEKAERELAELREAIARIIAAAKGARS